MVASMGGHKRALTWKVPLVHGGVVSAHRSLACLTTDCQGILTSTVRNLCEEKLMCCFRHDGIYHDIADSCGVPT